MADAQRKLEAFRVRQYGGPHPAAAAHLQQQADGTAAGGSAPQAVAAAAPGSAAAPPGAAAAPAPPAEHIEPDTGRCVLHFDIDCFYAQVEEVRDPSLRGRPVGVTQKYLVVTANYAARQQGVGKLVNVAEARRRCPSIVLVSGEDLTPYRAASKQIQAVLRRFGPVEKLGLDEFYVDATPEAQRRLAALRATAGGGALRLPPWRGHVHTSATQLMQDSKYRPMDLRAVGAGASGAAEAASAAARLAGCAAADGRDAVGAQGGGGSSSGGSSWEELLRLGSMIAAEARAAVLAEAGYRASAGIAANKLLAKLCSGLHKPDDQTVLPPPEAAAFVAPLPVRALTGVGHKTEEQLQALAVSTAADLRALPRAQLVAQFGERVGALLHAACRGKDPSPVQERGPPKSVTVEDSFKSCPSFAAAEKVVRVLAPDLLARLQEELQEEGRRPATLTVKWRLAQGSYQRSSASCPMPAAVLGRGVPQDQQVAALATAALGLLRRNLKEPFDLSLINIGASGFSEGAAAAAAGHRDIASMLGGGKRPAGGAAAAAGGQPAAVGQQQQPPPPPPPQQQWQQQQQQWQQQQPQWQPPLPAAGKAAAAASAEQRRSYSGALQQAPLLSKRLERQLREQPQQAQHVQQQVQPLPAAPATWHAAPAVPPAPQHAQRSMDEWGLRDGWGEELQQEEAEDDFWGDLQNLQSWHSGSAAGGGSRRQPSPAAPPPADGRESGDGMRQQPQLQPQPATGGKLLARLSGSSSAAGAGAAAGCGTESGGRVVLHCDVDSFYVAVERLDDPSLCGKPLAVQQFNSGGFVAVSYEARAAGIRCGDGAGAAGRAAIPHLVRMQAASLEECRRRCPGLVVRPMRTDRYREVAQQIHALLRNFAPDGQVEKTSYDDFYLDISSACTSDSSLSRCTSSGGGAAAVLSAQQGPPEGLLFLPADPSPVKAEQQQQQQQPGGPPLVEPQQAPQAQQAQRQWALLPPDLRRGVQLGAAVRAALKQQLGITLSCGVARNKLLARLASPCGKPDGLAVVPDGAERAFISQVPLRKVPQLRGKFGEAVAADLGVSSVGQLASTPQHELVRRYGEQRGAFLAALPLAQDDAPVRERGPQKSLAAERSFPPLPSEAAAATELAPLAQTLLARAAEDTREHGRLPAKLVVSYRQGYGSNPRSKSGAAPAEALSWLQAARGQPQLAAGIEGAGEPQPLQGQAEAAAQAGAGPAEAAVVAAALALLRPAVAAGSWQLTRLAVAFAYPDSSSNGNGQPQAAQLAGQQKLGAFVQRGQGSQQASAAGPAPTERLAREEPALPLAPAQQQQQQQQQQQKQPDQHPPVQQLRPVPASRPATYRNAEALALQRLFGSSGGSTHTGGDAVPAVLLAELPAELSAEERASLELALRLQQEEAQAAAAQAAARKRGAAAAGGGTAGAGGGSGGKPKQQRRGNGPLDAFFKRPGG